MDPRIILSPDNLQASHTFIYFICGGGGDGGGRRWLLALQTFFFIKLCSSPGKLPSFLQAT